MKLLRTLGFAAAATAAMAAANTAQADDIVIGMMCDRTGVTAVTGTVLCPGYHDYIALVNANGGIEGCSVKANEVDIEYKVPPAVEAYQRFKSDGAVLVSPFGTPMVAALLKRAPISTVSPPPAESPPRSMPNHKKTPATMSTARPTKVSKIDSRIGIPSLIICICLAALAAFAQTSFRAIRKQRPGHVRRMISFPGLTL